MYNVMLMSLQPRQNDLQLRTFDLGIPSSRYALPRNLLNFSFFFIEIQTLYFGGCGQ